MLLYGGGVVILIIIIIFFVNKSNKEKKLQENISGLDSKITSGQIAGTITGATAGKTEDPNYNPQSDAETIYNAGCFSYLCYGGDEQAVATVLRKLNGSQLLKLKNYFEIKYGKSLESYFQSYFYESERRVITAALAQIR